MCKKVFDAKIEIKNYKHTLCRIGNKTSFEEWWNILFKKYDDMFTIWSTSRSIVKLMKYIKKAKQSFIRPRHRPQIFNDFVDAILTTSWLCTEGVKCWEWTHEIDIIRCFRPYDWIKELMLMLIIIRTMIVI